MKQGINLGSGHLTRVTIRNKTILGKSNLQTAFADLQLYVLPKADSTHNSTLGSEI